ncbi:MAG: lipoyl(octanoyl) transferase LipB [Candidatus Acetothermia bacterium]
MANESDSKVFRIEDLGLTAYEESYERQGEIFDRHLSGKGDDVLIVTRHEPTITMGKSASEEDLLVSRDILGDRGVELVEIGRGGGITYHGPGQLVLYPLFDLRNYGKDLKDFVRRLGLVMEKTVESFGLNVEFLENERIGLWIQDEQRKLGSIGLSVKRWYTMHGLALNVDLADRKAGLIRPCGVRGSELVSMTDFVAVDLEQVKERILESFVREFE